jgi:hypothetical protein
MQIDLSTPALLFPAISLLFLAYTNRFLSLANLVRALHADYRKQPDERTLAQIHNLRRRIYLIRNMQACGLLSMIGCLLSMLLIYMEIQNWGRPVFGISVLLLIASLALSFREIQISVQALDLHLKDMENRS